MKHIQAHPRGFFNRSFVFRRTSVLSPRRGRLPPSHVFVRWSLLKSSRWHTTTCVTRRSQRELVLQWKTGRCLFLCSRLSVSGSSSPLTPEQKDTHSRHENTLTVNSFLLWIAGCSLSNTDWTLGKEKTHKWIDIIKRDARRSFERSVGFLTTSVSYRQKKKKPWHAALTDTCVQFSQLYEATKKKKKKKKEEETKKKKKKEEKKKKKKKNERHVLFFTSLH